MRIVASVPKPPCTTSWTIGTCQLLETYASRELRSSISAPHASWPVVPLSTSRKLEWNGFSGAPSLVCGEAL